MSESVEQGLSFSGLESATAISDKRVTLEWPAATGGTGTVVYTIYRDRNFAAPIATTQDTSYLVSGLTIGTTYNFIVRASDSLTEEENNNIKFVTTLSSASPDFSGIKTLTAAAGLDGETKLIATWDAATPPATRTIGYYNIYVSTTSDGQNFSSATYQTTGTSYTISGLNSGTRYYVVVRAEDDTGSEEKNSVEKNAQTTISSTISFGGLNSASPGAGISAFNTVNLSWTAATGSFNEYQVYVATVSGAQNYATPTKTVFSFFTTSQLTAIDGLLPNTTYYIVVRACNTISLVCDSNTVQRTVLTAPASPSFNGITSATLPNGIDGLTKVNIAWSAATGVFNKYKVFIRYPSGGGPAAFNFALNGGNTDYANAIAEIAAGTNTAQITGLTQDVPVCFAVRAVYADGTNFLEDTQSPIAERCATPTLAPPTFSGIASVSGGASVYASTLTWAAASGVFDEYRVFVGDTAAKARAVADNVAEPCAAITPACRYTVSPAATSYVYSPVAPNTTYYYLVRARYTGTGTTDGNNVVLSDTGGAATANHGGWRNVKALGDTYSKQTGLMSNASVTIEWNAFTATAGSITSYNVYRASAPGAIDLGVPYATGILPSSRMYTDTAVNPSDTYYYKVRAIIGSSVLTTTYGGDELKVIIPPDNMALVHRWIVNQDICGLMGRTTDAANNFRCTYTGPGNLGGFYDIEKSFFVDQFEVGCNYTPGPTGCSLTNGCLTGGTGSPVIGGATGSVNEIMYLRNVGTSASVCSIKTDASTWTPANTNWLTDTHRQTMITNAAEAPPLTSLSHENAWNTCQSINVPGFGDKKLPSRRHQVAFMSWHPSLSTSAITDLQNGTGLATSKSCNAYSNNADVSIHGVAYSQWPVTDLRSLPSIYNNHRILSTGTTATENCKTRYGIQDAYGNVQEMLAEGCSSWFNGSGGPHYCSTGISNYDNTISDFSSLNFDGVTLPGNSVGSMLTFSYAVGGSYDRVLVPLGLAVRSTQTTLDAIVVGSGVGEIPLATFYSHFYRLGVASWYAGSRTYPLTYTNRWGINPVPYDRAQGTNPAAHLGTATDLGFRCILDAE